jgi:uncharacterized OB-fold protein
MTGPRPAPVTSPDDEAFWEYTARGELRLQRCSPCGRFRFPPAPCCPDCLSTASDWVPVSGHGRVLSWVRFHRSYFDGLPAPYVVAVVELVEGPLVVGNVDGVGGHDELRAGRDVRVVFEQVDLEGGGVLTLPQWQLID